MDRLYATITTFFYSKGIKKKVEDFVKTCDSFQRNKKPGRGYVENPPREATDQPFDTVAVDCIGPWEITIPNAGTLKINALTMTDMATILTELRRLENGTSAHVTMQFENHWLARYPRPTKCIHDQGIEFMAQAFQDCLHRNGIQSAPITVKNPQANAVAEQMHSTVGDILRSMLHENPPQNVEQAYDIVDTALASTMFAMRATVHRTLQMSPGAIVFHRDMFQPIPLLIDHARLQARRQVQIDENTRRANLKRNFKDYVAGDEVLVLTYKPNKLEPRAVGPFTIDQVHVNGTVTIRRNNNVLERINVRRIRPYERAP